MDVSEMYIVCVSVYILCSFRCVCVCIYICVCVYMYVCMCVYIYIYMLLYVYIYGKGVNVSKSV